MTHPDFADWKRRYGKRIINSVNLIKQPTSGRWCGWAGWKYVSLDVRVAPGPGTDAQRKISIFGAKLEIAPNVTFAINPKLGQPDTPPRSLRASRRSE